VSPICEVLNHNETFLPTAIPPFHRVVVVSAWLQSVVKKSSLVINIPWLRTFDSSDELRDSSLLAGAPNLDEDR
jgi:hypothetical protein